MDELICIHVISNLDPKYCYVHDFFYLQKEIQNLVFESIITQQTVNNLKSIHFSNGVYHVLELYCSYLGNRLCGGCVTKCEFCHESIS